ncbi:restriction endonuclease subunit S [Spiroplasma endosymbiont of Aspidapion aeneum]|uniref:restriction endonuclease subunit S n=1 Tax=Spiroplasma endosymbiont of Aspidapion aeneum TaxID=3066276 RepID=UPI00313DF5E2
MAIYKLGELILGKPIYGSNQRGLASGKYKYLTQSDIILKSPRVFVNNTDGKVLKKDDFIISRAGTILPYLHEINEEWVYAGYLIKYRLNKNLCIPKYVYYWFKGPGNKTLNQYSNTGSTMPKMNPNTSLNIKINLPNLKEQQKIIDIIEPVEEVFFRYKQCIRLDTYENTKNDIRKIIDIIEPVDNLQRKILILMSKIKLLLIKFYQINPKPLISIKKRNYFLNKKRVNQNLYFPTSSIGEFTLNIDKSLDIKNLLISRANVIPKEGTFIISKLIGENKIYYFDKVSENHVFSTGFFNIESISPDDFSSFILSHNYLIQKSNLANGTTMLSINNDTFSKLITKDNWLNSNIYSKMLYLVSTVSSKIDNLRTLLIGILL